LARAGRDENNSVAVVTRAKEIFIVKSFLRELDNSSSILRLSLGCPVVIYLAATHHNAIAERRRSE
jgi:hypothetical protein